MHEMQKEVKSTGQAKLRITKALTQSESLTFNSIKLVIFTSLDSSTSQKRTKIVYKIDTGCNESLMLFRVFRILFPKSTMAEPNATINRTIVLKTYNQSDIEWLGRCSVKISQNDKCVTGCRFFVVPGWNARQRIAQHNKSHV